MTVNYDAMAKAIQDDDVELMQMLEVAQGIKVIVGHNCDGGGGSIFAGSKVFCTEYKAPRITEFLRERQRDEDERGMPAARALVEARNAMDLNDAIAAGLYPLP
jgi:hypothetical protein